MNLDLLNYPKIMYHFTVGKFKDDEMLILIKLLDLDIVFRMNLKNFVSRFSVQLGARMVNTYVLCAKMVKSESLIHGDQKNQ